MASYTNLSTLVIHMLMKLFICILNYLLIHMYL
jgi:hypothetical protein